MIFFKLCYHYESKQSRLSLGKQNEEQEVYTHKSDIRTIEVYHQRGTGMTTVLQALNSFQLQLGNEAQPQLEWMTDTSTQCGHYNPREPFGELFLVI